MPTCSSTSASGAIVARHRHDGAQLELILREHDEEGHRHLIVVPDRRALVEASE